MITNSSGMSFERGIVAYDPERDGPEMGKHLDIIRDVLRQPDASPLQYGPWGVTHELLDDGTENFLAVRAGQERHAFLRDESGICYASDYERFAGAQLHNLIVVAQLAAAA